MAAPTLGVLGTTTFAGAGQANIPYNYPATVDAGDLLFIHYRGTGNAAMAITNADGWTFPSAWRHSAAGAGTSFVGWKVAAGTEGGTSSNITTDASPLGNTIVFSVTGQDASGWLDDSSATTASATGVPTFTIPALTTLGPDRMLLWFAATNTDRANDWQTLNVTDNLDTNEIYDFVGPSARQLSASWETQSSAGSSGTRQVSWNNAGAAGNGLPHGVGVAIAPDPPPATPTGLTATAIFE